MKIKKMLWIVMVGILLTACAKKEEAQETQTTESQTIVKEVLGGKIEIGKYKGFEVEADKPEEITDELIDQWFAEQYESAISYKEAPDQPIAINDMVTYDYSFYQNGELLEGSEKKDVIVVVGTESFLSGAELNFVDKKLGDTVETDIIVPEGDDQPFAGQSVTVKMTITIHRTPESIEINDEFVQKTLGYSTIAEYKASMKEEFQKSSQYNYEVKVENIIWQLIREEAKIIAHPEEEIEKRYQQSLALFKQQLEASGMAYEDYIASNYEGSEETLLAEMKESVRSQMEVTMITYAIADIENITVDRSRDLNEEEQQQLIDYFGLEGKEQLEETKAEGADLYEYLLVAKVADFLYENNQVKTK